MADKISFWKGVSAGFLAGMTIAAALRYTRFEKFIVNLSTVDGKLDRGLEAIEEKLNHSTPLSLPADLLMQPEPTPIAVNFAFRKDREDRSEERQTRDSVTTGAVASFLRAGNRAATGTLETPADPGERADHLDLSKPLRPYPRNLDLGSAG